MDKKLLITANPSLKEEVRECSLEQLKEYYKLVKGEEKKIKALSKTLKEEIIEKEGDLKLEACRKFVGHKVRYGLIEVYIVNIKKIGIYGANLQKYQIGGIGINTKNKTVFKLYDIKENLEMIPFSNTEEKEELDLLASKYYRHPFLH